MQITSKTIAGKKVVFESILDEIPGGVGVNVTRLDYTKVNETLSVDKRYLKAGAPVYVDIATRTAEVCKSALAINGGGATTPRVGKNHHFKVGDILNDGVTSSTISAIDETVAGYDILTVGEALLYAAGTKYGQGSATGTSAALTYTPNGLTKEDIFIGDGNADAAIVTIGSVRADALEYPINALYAAGLRGTKSLITIV